MTDYWQAIFGEANVHYFQGSMQGGKTWSQMQQAQAHGRSQRLKHERIGGGRLIAFGVHNEPVFEIEALAVRTYPEDQVRKT